MITEIQRSVVSGDQVNGLLIAILLRLGKQEARREATDREALQGSGKQIFE